MFGFIEEKINASNNINIFFGKYVYILIWNIYLIFAVVRGRQRMCTESEKNENSKIMFAFANQITMLLIKAMFDCLIL